ncbi:hypothetical protein EKL29_08005 [Pantoea sp. YU22]|uniref:hypothetical protein n=1 Tax=Pantoea TaxID=53335 RepID=UPI000F899B40|nr:MULTISPECIES: hypothetical protein [Pantoea]RTY58766.1 hypothetical protein EKL29_08005 [Pantoea sp. YU22]
MKITENEMRGLLAGKCLPSDILVGENLAAYLVRKFSALQQKLDAAEEEAEAYKAFAEQDYFGNLVIHARARASKAMSKFPQPNYVLTKVAEESGELVKAGVHFAEGRETWGAVEQEAIDTIAMIIRLMTEGDEVIGLFPPQLRAGKDGE